MDVLGLINCLISLVLLQNHTYKLSNQQLRYKPQSTDKRYKRVRLPLLLEVLEGPGCRLQGGRLCPRGNRDMSSTVGFEQRYFPREKVFEMNNVEIDEEQLISLMYHASHGIMQLQIQQTGRSINDFQTLDELKVFFSQQHNCDQ
jgi:hypothetical protein